MNRECQKQRERLADNHYQTLSPESRADLKNHLAECPACAELAKTFSQTLNLMSLRSRPEPETEAWERIWARAEHRLQAETKLRQPKPVPLIVRPWFRWVFQPALALSLLVVGVLIGRYFFPNAPDNSQNAVSVRPGPLLPSNLDVRIDRYLQKSKVIILAFDNLDPQNAQDNLFDFHQEKSISRELVQETVSLRNDLNAAGSDRMLDLISDLEVILMQISNLDRDFSPLELELVQSGIARRALLFKINLEEMKRWQDVRQPVRASGSTPRDI